MSYVEAYSGKIAGYGRLTLHGLGDAAYDAAVAAYNADHTLWLQQKAAYDQAVAAYAGQSAGQSAEYSIAQGGYQRDLTAWNSESAARTAAVVARSQQQVSNQRLLDNANAAARAAGVVTPAGYPGCVTQAQHNSWQAICNTVNAPVKGLGADPTGPACALALLPVCIPALPAIAPLRPKPVPPAPPPTLIPPAAIRPEPQPPPAPAPSAQPTPTPTGPTPYPSSPSNTPPVLNTGPQPIPSLVPTASPPPTPPSKSGGLISNGLLVVVLAAGGYALYRTFKKPKAAA